MISVVSSAPADLASNIGQSTDGTCVQDTRQQCSEEKQEKSVLGALVSVIKLVDLNLLVRCFPNFLI